MANGDLARVIQHTELTATADRARIRTVLDECVEYGFDAAVVQPCWVPLAAERLADTGVSVCAVIGFTLGGETTLTKVTAVRDALAGGADEVDVLANLGWLKSGDDESLRTELDAVAAAAGAAPCKLVIELGGLTGAEAERAIEAAAAAGFDYVKNSSGFGAGGEASVEAIEFIADRVPPEVGIKASGGIDSAARARALLEAGADLLGASRSVDIVTGAQDDDGA